MEKVIDLESQKGINTKIIEENIIKKITPKIEEKIKSEIVRAIVDSLEEKFYPPEEMIREDFIKEVEEAEKRVKEGKVKSFKNAKELNTFLESLKNE